MKTDELVEILKGDGDAEEKNDMAQSGIISEEVRWSPLLTLQGQLEILTW